MAEYFKVDPTVVRVLWVLSVFAGGLGLLAYAASWILVPENREGIRSSERSASQQQETRAASPVQQNLFWGVVLVLMGSVMFLDDMEFLRLRWLVRTIPGDVVWPMLLIASGAVLVASARPDSPPRSGTAPEAEAGRSFRRVHSRRKVWGVCAGLGEMLGVDVSIVRLLWVLVTFVSVPVGVVTYVMVGLLAADEFGHRLLGRRSGGGGA
jgi:phage shock protein PspC (stress-responsive transcriptional regulator)